MVVQLGSKSRKAKGYSEEKGKTTARQRNVGSVGPKLGRTEQSVLRKCWWRGHGSMCHGLTCTKCGEGTVRVSRTVPETGSPTERGYGSRKSDSKILVRDWGSPIPSVGLGNSHQSKVIKRRETPSNGHAQLLQNAALVVKCSCHKFTIRGINKVKVIGGR